jgi:small subunit ribosomal protein S20
MANHISAEKRARQAIKRAARNTSTKSAIHTAERRVRENTDPQKGPQVLSEAFSSIQKARGVVHRNTVRRKMARLAKAVASAAKKA